MTALMTVYKTVAEPGVVISPMTTAVSVMVIIPAVLIVPAYPMALQLKITVVFAIAIQEMIVSKIVKEPGVE